MINGKTVSVLITTYHPSRASTLSEVVRGWLDQPVDEVLLLDNGGQAWLAMSSVESVIPVTDFDGDHRFLYWRMPWDFKTRADYGVALLTDGDLIICADDDVVPSEGFAQDLVSGWDKVGGFVGIIGRVFKGEDYYKDCPYYNSAGVEKITRVGFTGVVYLASRSLFGFDTRGMLPNCDDLWHQMKVHTYSPKHVVPTKNYRNLPCASDKTAMFKNTALKSQRNAFFAEYYKKYYGPKGREF